MITVFAVLFVVGVFLVGLALGRLHGMEREMDDMRQLILGRRVPYRVVEDVENRQAKVVDRLLWVRHTLDEIETAMRQEIELYNDVLQRDPLEGDGRARHKVRAK